MHVADTKEVIRMLCAQLPGFRRHFHDGFYKVRVDGEYINKDNVDMVVGYHLHEKSIVHIIPVIAGAKEGGVWQAIAGVALIVVGYFTANPYIAAMGVSLLVGGVATMLTPVPKGASGQDSSRNDSTSFSNLDNLEPQGRPVPLCYGEILTGSLSISQELQTYAEKVDG